MTIKEKERGLISYIRPDSQISEQYRTIRTNIYFSSVDQKYKSLLITSPGNKEGKSTTVTNLAISMVQQGEKVLIVDADLRRPTLHTIFNMENATGLTNVLNKEKTFGEAVKRTEIERLDVITSGPIPFNPVELLSSAVLDQLIETAQKLYSVILFDSSPVLELTDARVLANKCDGTILVVGKGKTKVDEVVEAKRILEFARAKCVGVILNNK